MEVLNIEFNNLRTLPYTLMRLMCSKCGAQWIDDSYDNESSLKDVRCCSCGSVGHIIRIE